MRHSSSGMSKGSASVARSASSGTTTTSTSTSRTKFLSRSHNSLLLLPQAPPDYSKVESKVRKYIDAMKELGRQRRQGQPTSPDGRRQSADQSEESSILTSTGAPRVMGSRPEIDDEKTIELKRQLAEREARVCALQEDHDRLLLDNARLENMLDEMRAKIRMQQLKNQQKIGVRRTNSPSDEDPQPHQPPPPLPGDPKSTSCRMVRLMMLPTAANSTGDNDTASRSSSSSFKSSSNSSSSSLSGNLIAAAVHRENRNQRKQIHSSSANERSSYTQRHAMLDDT